MSLGPIEDSWNRICKDANALPGIVISETNKREKNADSVIKILAMAMRNPAGNSSVERKVFRLRAEQLSQDLAEIVDYLRASRQPLMQPRKASQAPAVPKPAVPKTAGSKTVVPGPSGPSVRASGVPLQVVVPLDDKNMRLLSEYLIQKSVVQVLQLIASLPRLSSSELAGVHYALSKDPKISKEKLHAVWTVVTTALDLEDALKKLPNDTSVNTHVIAQLRKKSVLIETLGQAALAFIVDRLQAHPDAAIKKG